MQETEINLVDLFVEILLRWRIIIVWMLVGAVLMGGFSFVRSYNAAEAQKKNSQEKTGESITEEEYFQEQLTDKQINNVKRVLNYEKYLEGIQAYMDNSVLMHLDAQQIPRMELTFLVTASDAETAASIEKVYEDTISSGFIQWLIASGQDELDSAALKELVGVQRSSRGLVMGSDSFGVLVIHETEDQCIDLAEQVIAFVKEQQPRLQKLMGDHTIEVANQFFVYVTDTTLMATQKNTQSEIVEYVASIVQLKEAFSDEEQMYYDFMTQEETSDALEEDNAGNSENKTLSMTQVETPSVSVKYVILGMILFAFVYIVYAILKYVLNNRLREYDNVSKMFGISQLALISAEPDNKKGLAVVDCWIRKLRNHNKRVFSEEEAIGLAAVAVKMQVQKENLDSIYCVGCDIRDRCMKVAQHIQDILKKEDVEMSLLNNILYNQEALEKVQGAKAVFLLEKAGETLYDEILRELEVLQRQGIRILGIIVVG